MTEQDNSLPDWDDLPPLLPDWDDLPPLQEQPDTTPIQLEELTITIKAVRLGKKQLTQSVYLQLPEKNPTTEPSLIREASILGCIHIVAYRVDRWDILWTLRGKLYRCDRSSIFSAYWKDKEQLFIGA